MRFRQVEKQTARDLKVDLKAAKKMRLPWWGVLCVMIGVIPVYILFDHFEKPALTMPIASCVGAIVFAIVLKWNLRTRASFWITMTVIAALHVPLILFVPWPTKWVPAAEFAGFASIDLYVMLAILSFVGNVVERPKTSER
jgi:hypothetical protein